MRLSTDDGRDEEVALETISAAVEAGITAFDTARSYGLDETELGHNERLLARALRRCGAEGRARIVTKGGMARSAGAWIPDGRAKAIRADCEASVAVLDGLAIDLYLIHAPDQRTPWHTSVRALSRLVEDGLVRRVGLANVNRRQLDEALELAPVAAVQVALSAFDDRALRGGVVERCEEAGIAVIAHSPLGGPRRPRRVARHQVLVEVAERRGATPAEVALAWLLTVSRSSSRSPELGARRRHAPPHAPQRSSSRRTTEPSSPARSAGLAQHAARGLASSKTRTRSSSWASREPGRAGSRRSTWRVATSA
jgi:aryl-alcohol dehydrogenase-like predicted oxidoreductase